MISKFGYELRCGSWSSDCVVDTILRTCSRLFIGINNCITSCRARAWILQQMKRNKPKAHALSPVCCALVQTARSHREALGRAQQHQEWHGAHPLLQTWRLGNGLSQTVAPCHTQGAVGFPMSWVSGSCSVCYWLLPFCSGLWFYPNKLQGRAVGQQWHPWSPQSLSMSSPCNPLLPTRTPMSHNIYLWSVLYS